LAYPDAEAAVLGAILLEPARLATIRPLLPDPTSFADPAHAGLYRAICGLADASLPLDPVTLGARYPETGDAAHEVMGAAYGTEHLEVHAALLADATRRRATLALADRLAARAKSPDLPLAETLSGLVRAVADLDKDKPGKPQPLATTLYHIIEGIGKPSVFGATRGVPSGLKGLDDLLDGFRSGLHILAANPKEGKSALALQVARRAAEHGPVWIDSLEMNQEELAGRLLQAEIGKSLKWLGEDDARLTEWMPRITEAAGRIARLPLTITQGLKTPSSVMLAWQAECAQGRTPGLVVIDYVQLMKPDARQESRNLDIAEITGPLKQWSLKYSIPMLVLSQLSRENKRGTIDPLTKERSPRRPRLSDLRDSGSIEQDADSVTFLYWPSEERGAGEVRVDLMVEANRNGPCGVVRTRFKPWVFTFTEEGVA
jgi:replicative DNA helicase